MTDREAMKLALEAMKYADACLKKQLTTKTKHEYAQDLLMDAGVALRNAIAEAEKQEPVAWMHRHIDGNVITHKPADLNRHPDRWTPLYKNPTPCETCQALARTVMMDQTAHDTPPAAQQEPLTEEQIDDIWNRYCDEMGEASINDACDIARAIEAAHGITGERT